MAFSCAFFMLATSACQKPVSPSIQSNRASQTKAQNLANASGKSGSGQSNVGILNLDQTNLVKWTSWPNSLISNQKIAASGLLGQTQLNVDSELITSEGSQSYELDVVVKVSTAEIRQKRKIDSSQVGEHELTVNTSFILDNDTSTGCQHGQFN